MRYENVGMSMWLIDSSKNMPFINIFQHLQYWSEKGLISPLLDSPVTQKKSSTFLKLYFWRLFFRKQTHYSAQWQTRTMNRLSVSQGKAGDERCECQQLALETSSPWENCLEDSHRQGFKGEADCDLHLPPYHQKVTFIYIRESFRNHQIYG